MSSVLRIHPEDSLAVALKPLAKDALVRVGDKEITVREPIRAKQKLVLVPLAAGDTIHMYGVPVGTALQPLQPGNALLRQHILHDAAPYSAAAKQNYNWQQPDNSRFAEATFQGYYRPDGRVGSRNHWLVVPLVFCENRNIQSLQHVFEKALGYSPVSVFEQRLAQWIRHYSAGKSADSFLFKPLHERASSRFFQQVDGIAFLTHELGCGGSREDARTLCRLLASYINHPNVGGATVLSLGCQNATINWLRESLHELAPHFDKPLFIIEQQEAGSNELLLQQAIDQTFAGLTVINRQQRQAAPLSKLVLGLKCGGSDGFSGISANPALGYASDLLVSLGGSSILAEFPELCGVEQELINRCTTDAAAEKFERLMRNYAALSESFGNPFHMNPSEGNLRDGLLTDAMKSAGAARKGGTAPITAVLDYTEPVREAGLHLLCTPGNDVEATTGIAGSGATVTVFTTGMGTPTGNPVSPVLKISSNSQLYERMPDVIDFDCGGIIEGTQTIIQGGEELLKKIIATASGKETWAEHWQQKDFIPWRKSISV
jgi:altronate hydrolase